MEWDTYNFLLFWAIFCFYTLLATAKIKILKQWKRHLERSSLYTCAPKITIIWCMLPDIWNTTDIFFSHFGPFFTFYPLKTQKIKILKKWKKCVTISSFCTSVSKIMIICYTVPEIWRVMDVIVIFYFWLFFLPFSPPNNPKNKNFKKMKKTYGDIIILHMYTKNYD